MFKIALAIFYRSPFPVPCSLFPVPHLNGYWQKKPLQIPSQFDTLA